MCFGVSSQTELDSRFAANIHSLMSQILSVCEVSNKDRHYDAKLISFAYYSLCDITNTNKERIKKINRCCIL